MRVRDDDLDVIVIELGLAQINRHGAHTCVDLGETAYRPVALEANLAHRGRDRAALDFSADAATRLTRADAARALGADLARLEDVQAGRARNSRSSTSDAS